MSIQIIQKSQAFKPEMIGDIVEVTVYDQSDGALHTLTGDLVAYSTSPAGTVFKLNGLEQEQTVPAKGYTISITHYEFVLSVEGGDDE